MDNRFERGYALSRPKRIQAIVNYYGADAFRNATVLEVGAGYGDLGATFAREMGAKVTCTDGRPEYIDIIKERYPYVDARVQDLEKEWPFDEKFDFIIHSGVLHHLSPKSIEQALRDACEGADNIILELEVYDAPKPVVISVKEPDIDGTKALYNMGSRPTTSWIETKLTELGMGFERHTDPTINGPANFTWEPGRAPAGPRRLWYIWQK